MSVDWKNWDGGGEGFDCVVGETGIGVGEIDGGWSGGCDGEGVETGLKGQKGARAIVGDTMLDALVEDEGGEIGGQFIEAVVDDWVVGRSHLKEVAMVGAAVEVGGLEQVLEAEDTVGDPEDFADGVVSLELWTSEGVADEAERLMILHVVRV